MNNALKQLTIDEAQRLSFRVVDTIARNFNGHDFLSEGDVGKTVLWGRPETTVRAEKTIADLFGCEDAILLRGSGTGAIGWALSSLSSPGDMILVHSSPMYPTTDTNFTRLGIKAIPVDYNNLQEFAISLSEVKDIIKAVYIQHSRQTMEDMYEIRDVITTAKTIAPTVPILVDDNYVVFKRHYIGCEVGAELSSFSCFKTLGPEGIGVVVGKHLYIQKIREWQYSGGGQVQGYEALDVLRGFVYVPVAAAIASTVVDELVERIAQGEVSEVKNAVAANCQSKCVILELKHDIVEEVLATAPKYGAAPHPVGSESKYEILPYFGHASGSTRASDPERWKRLIRINPMRSGADTVIRILKSTLLDLEEGR